MLESEETIENKFDVVIGFGVNCTNHPKSSIYPTTNLKEQGFHIRSKDLFQCLVKRIDQLLYGWNRGMNFKMVRDLWLTKALGIGQSITIKLAGGELKGVFENIDESGFLELRLKNSELKKISAGDVFLS